MNGRRRLLASGELAAVLGVSRRAVSYWAQRGWITPAEKTAGGQYRWVEADVREQLRRRRRQ